MIGALPLFAFGKFTPGYLGKVEIRDVGQALRCQFS